jgi:hypothetical protein
MQSLNQLLSFSCFRDFFLKGRHSVLLPDFPIQTDTQRSAEPIVVNNSESLHSRPQCDAICRIYIA